ncbi:MAG: sigma factor-like helix-turn-helix DNA-binding protein [Bacillota bacterium]
MEKHIGLGLLNDYYGALLTSHQSEMIRLYYDMDLSLAEIADQYNITRQGVREVLLRSQKKLEEYELKLGLVGKIAHISTQLDAVISECKDATVSAKIQEILREVKEI